MFAAVLKQVTGYFDRRALLSTFFPTLAFLAAVIVAAAAVGPGIAAAASAWGRQPGLVQAVGVTGFLVAVTLISLLVNNLRPAIDQAFQGEWPGGVAAARPAAWLIARHYRRRARLMAADDALERKEIAIAVCLRAMPEPGPPTTVGPYDAGQADRDLAELEALLAAGTGISPVLAEPEGVGERLARLAGAIAADPAAAAGHVERFTAITLAAQAVLESTAEHVREQRARVQQDLFLLFAAHPAVVVGTRLGNIMRAAEQYPRARYRLDPVVTWSRLQPLLPRDVSAPLKDAKAAVDILLTCAVYLVVAGMSGAAWAGMYAPAHRDPAVTALAIVGAGLASVVLLPPMSGRLGRLLAAGCLAVSLTLSLVLGRLDRAPLWLAVAGRSADAVLLAAGALALALALYLGACQAALAYAEELRAVFDMHRWRVLQQLRLPLPASLAGERETWETLMRFLYRGDLPDPSAFRYSSSQPVDAERDGTLDRKWHELIDPQNNDEL
jgi:hypothetical protein